MLYGQNNNNFSLIRTDVRSELNIYFERRTQSLMRLSVTSLLQRIFSERRTQLLNADQVNIIGSGTKSAHQLKLVVRNEYPAIVSQK